MKFSELERITDNIKDVLVIGRTIIHEEKTYHIIGMALIGDVVNLYILEPFEELDENNMSQASVQKTNREILMKNSGFESRYMGCEEFVFGDKKLKVQSSSAGSLRYDVQNYEILSLFAIMMKAGWKVPDELKEIDWEDLQIVTHTMADIDSLPEYRAEMPITIQHSSNYSKNCFVEKPVVLETGKPCEFTFNYDDGEEVHCYINNVSLVDIWNEMRERFNEPRYKEMVTKEELEEIKKMTFEALEQNCPEGMYYINIEYECTKKLNLQFYTKEFLQSFPKEHNGSGASSMFLHSKPEKDTGTHGLPLNSYIIQFPVSADTVEVPAELLFYFENIPAWDETI